MGKIEVVGMVYRSKAFLDLLVRQFEDEGCQWRIVANDPTAEIIAAFESGRNVICGETYHDPNPQDHYLARVYRCWNYCVESSSAEYVCLVNSDMAFSPGWLDALERRLDGKTLPVSRLVEPGLLRPGMHAVEIDLGRDPRTFPFDSWHLLSKDLADSRVEPGGLFMPCVLHRETFLQVGGYPHGNIDGRSGDAILFDKMAQAGFAHVTCFDSLVYHMQEGEMRYPL
jgi:hypothetical protein